METKLWPDVDRIKLLGDRLSECPMVNQYGAEEAPTLAIAFADIEQSMVTFLNEQLTRIMDPSVRGEELEDALMDAREEFRHIAYHLHDPQFFRVIEPTHDWLNIDENKLGKING